VTLLLDPLWPPAEDLCRDPVLAILAALDATLTIATRALIAAHPYANDHERPYWVQPELSPSDRVAPDILMIAHRLQAGDYRFALQSNDKTAQVHSLFLSTSKDFRPSLTTYGEKKDSYSTENFGLGKTLDRVYLRLRLVKGVPERKTYGFSAGTTYHHARRVPGGNKEGCWGWPLGTVEEVAAEDWSEFIDITEAVVPGGGPWSSAAFYLKGVTQGRFKLQLAWYPHESTVQKEVDCEVLSTRLPKYDGELRLRLPRPRARGCRSRSRPRRLP